MTIILSEDGNTFRSHTPRAAVKSLLCGMVVVVAGCTSVMHGYTTRDYQGRLLSPLQPEGAHRLELERGHDPNLSDFVTGNGLPDYIFVASANEVYLLYLSADQLVVSRRSGWSSAGKISTQSPIPDQFLSRLPSPDRSEIRAHRGPEGDPAPRPAERTMVSSGTCFAIDSAGQVVTALHVVDGASQIEVSFQDGGSYPARLYRWSKANDLALLQIDSERAHFIQVPQGRRPVVGQRVFTVGYATPSLLGGALGYSEGTVSSLSGFQGDASLFQVSVPIQPGNSGGPLLTEDGALVGVIIATTRAAEFLRITGTLPQNMNWAVPVAYVAGLLEETTEGFSPLERDEAIALASRATCLVRATR